MNTTPDDMSERILKRLAKRLLRCPFDEELFDSKEGLCEHLLAHHSTDICRKQRMPKQEALGDIDRPSKLTFCGHCLGNMVPHALGRNALSEIDRHIREAHPNPNGPAVITMTFSSDPALIDRFIEDQVSPEVCVCSEPGCGELFNSEPNVAAHWADRHCYPPTIEGVRRLLETDPERFGALLEECLKAEHDEVRSRLRQQPVADGSLIRRYPNVPRIRSRPSEYIVYVEGERATVRQEDFDEMLATEGMDAENDAPSNEPWTPHTVHLELRFCNIEGGFVPLVGELKSILRRLPDGGTIEVSWQNDPEFFHCIVSKSERAIYSSDGKLKRAFEGLPSGVVLYITSVAPLRYEFRLKPSCIPSETARSSFRWAKIGGGLKLKTWSCNGKRGKVFSGTNQRLMRWTHSIRKRGKPASACETQFMNSCGRMPKIKQSKSREFTSSCSGG